MFVKERKQCFIWMQNEKQPQMQIRRTGNFVKLVDFFFFLNLKQATVWEFKRTDTLSAIMKIKTLSLWCYQFGVKVKENWLVNAAGMLFFLWSLSAPCWSLRKCAFNFSPHSWRLLLFSLEGHFSFIKYKAFSTWHSASPVHDNIFNFPTWLEEVHVRQSLPGEFLTVSGR